MGFDHLTTIIITIILLSIPFPFPSPQAQQIKSTRLLDLLVRDFTFKSYTSNFKTGKIHNISLPANLSGIHVSTVRYRCGSLHRYGARVREFNIARGVRVHPCSQRTMLVRQNLGSNWSSLYYDNYELSGYQLISPVIGLLVYNIGVTEESTVPSELTIHAGKKPITIDFGNATDQSLSSGIIPLCASFSRDGRVTLSNQAGPNLCVTSRDGHFGLVVESPLMPMKQRRVSKWKIAIGSTIGVALGAVLLSLLVVAMLVNAKKKARMEEMERRAYEEEALQVSMVGHVRALTASGTRTVPAIEHDEESPT